MRPFLVGKKQGRHRIFATTHAEENKGRSVNIIQNPIQLRLPNKRPLQNSFSEMVFLYSPVPYKTESSDPPFRHTHPCCFSASASSYRKVLMPFRSLPAGNQVGMLRRLVNCSCDFQHLRWRSSTSETVRSIVSRWMARMRFVRGARSTKIFGSSCRATALLTPRVPSTTDDGLRLSVEWCQRQLLRMPTVRRRLMAFPHRFIHLPDQQLSVIAG